MNFPAYKLPINSVLVSGEIVKNVFPQTYPKKQVVVFLFDPKTEKIRCTAWGYYSTIFVKKTEVV